MTSLSRKAAAEEVKCHLGHKIRYEKGFEPMCRYRHPILFKSPDLHSRKAAVTNMQSVSSARPALRGKETDAALEKPFDEFIKKWCSSSAHLLDNDENDGERFRQLLREQEAQWQAAVKKHKARRWLIGDYHKCFKCRYSTLVSLPGKLCRDCAMDEDFGKVE